MSKNLSADFYRKHRKTSKKKKKLVKDFKVFVKKSDNMVLIDIKISQKMKKKAC